MKKIFLISVVFLFAMQTMAQKYFDVYQNGVVKNSIASSSLDSIGLTGSSEQNRMVNFYKDDYIVNSYLASSVDSIKVKNSYTLYAPTNVTASIIEDNYTIRLSWDAVSLAEGYDIYRSSTSSGEFAKVAARIASTSWNDVSPLSGSNYYRVHALWQGQTSPASNTAYVNYVLDAPTNVTATYDEDANEVTITWNPVTYAECYDVYRNGALLAENITSTLYVDNSPDVGNITYCVRAKRGDMESKNSDPAIVNIVVDKLKITVNGVEFTMIYVAGGTFQMGSNEYSSSSIGSATRPVHQVTLDDYYIGETEVTQELWQAVMGSNPSYYTTSNKQPVERVSWEDCQMFIANLNQLTGKQFRLPTEAEWEFAARGGNQSHGYEYSGSNNLSNVAWYDYNYSGKTHEVAKKSANELGIYDMSGNVQEWCQDWYGRYSSDAQTNPTGPSSGSKRVERGGCFNSSDVYCRVASRGNEEPDRKGEFLGLRLAL